MAKQAEPSTFRRSARVHVNVPITLSGKLPGGKSFTEDTYIISISKYGAKLRSNQPLQVGTRLKVQPKRGRQSGLFRVVWIGREGSPREGEIGIEYVRVSNLLGVTFPD